MSTAADDSRTCVCSSGSESRAGRVMKAVGSSNSASSVRLGISRSGSGNDADRGRTLEGRGGGDGGVGAPGSPRRGGVVEGPDPVAAFGGEAEGDRFAG